MITIISGTNRVNSNTEIVADAYLATLNNKQVANKYLKLTSVPVSIIHDNMYTERLASFNAIQDNYIKPATKFVIVSPEYNGSIPGFLKLFIDACDIKPSFKGKKVCLVGVASGRAGNLRGMDHLTSIMNHVGASVCPRKLPFSGINNLKNADGKLNAESLKLIDEHLDEFLVF